MQHSLRPFSANVKVRDILKHLKLPSLNIFRPTYNIKLFLSINPLTFFTKNQRSILHL